MKNWKPALVGLGLGALSIAPLPFLDPDRSLDILAALLAAIGGVYAGFAISDGRQPVRLLEIGIACVFLTWAVAGMWTSPAVLGAGYLAHGLWDIIHHPRGVKTTIAAWYPPFCLVYDVVVGVFILLYF